MTKLVVRCCAYWITRLHAARVAAQLRRELQLPVELAHGPYGEFKVLVDDETVIDGGALAFLGILPTRQEIIAAVRAHLAEAGNRH